MTKGDISVETVAVILATTKCPWSEWCPGRELGARCDTGHPSGIHGMRIAVWESNGRPRPTVKDESYLSVLV